MTASRRIHLHFLHKPLEVLGWDPHGPLVDYLVSRIEEAR